MKIFVMVFTFALLGCSHTKVLKPRHEFSLRGHATIVTADEQTYEAIGVEILKDSVLFVALSNSETKHYHRSEIDRIEIVRNNARQSAIIGAAVGAVYSIISYQKPPGGGANMSIVMIPMATVAGYLFGSLQSGEYTFIFEGNGNSFNLQTLP